MTSSTRLLPADLKAHRYIELDSIRGLAAFTVVISHFLGIWQFERWHLYLEISPLRVLFAGHEAVVLFFVLSGFVLSVQCSGRRPLPYRLFLLKRFCRIYIPFATAVLISAFCCLVLYSKASSGNLWADKSWTMRPTVNQVVMLLLTSMHHAEQLNVAIWSVLMEIRVSIIFPLLLWFSRRLHSAILLSAFILLSFICPGSVGLKGAFATLVSVSGLFIIGILLHKHLSQVSHWFLRRRVAGAALFISTAIVCFEATGPVIERFNVPSSNLLNVISDYIVGFGAAGILICAMNDKTFKTILQHPVLLRVGALSYSTYLIHATVLFVLIRLCFGKLPFYYLAPVYLLGVYLASELFHTLIDKPSVLLGRQFKV